MNYTDKYFNITICSYYNVDINNASTSLKGYCQFVGYFSP